jgi:hypothetical protein
VRALEIAPLREVPRHAIRRVGGTRSYARTSGRQRVARSDRIGGARRNRIAHDGKPAKQFDEESGRSGADVGGGEGVGVPPGICVVRVDPTTSIRISRRRATAVRLRGGTPTPSPPPTPTAAS